MTGVDEIQINLPLDEMSMHVRRIDDSKQCENSFTSYFLDMLHGNLSGHEHKVCLAAMTRHLEAKPSDAAKSSAIRGFTITDKRFGLVKLSPLELTDD